MVTRADEIPRLDRTRTPQQVRAHYEIEKALAARLRNASREERGLLYATVYDELFRRVPHHPQLTRKTGGRALSNKVALLERFLGPSSTFLEIGAGDCALSLYLAKQVRQVYAIDVSDEITRQSGTPTNFRLALSDGCSIPVPKGSVDVAFSNQLMEHLHPDDAVEQLGEIYEALSPGGVYLCVTPNRLTGPHDISRQFDRVATGLHLKEYTASEVGALFRQAGFRMVYLIGRCKGRYFRVPRFISKLLEVWPVPLKGIINIRMLGIK